MWSPFSDCINGKSKISIVLKSQCFKSKKIVFNIKTDTDTEKLFQEIKDLIKKYENNIL